MALTQQDKKEIKEMLQDCMSGNHARTESKFDVINLKLDNLIIQTTKTNGRVGVLEDKAHDFDYHVKNTEDYNQKIRKLEDTTLSQQSVKKFMLWMFSAGLAIGSLIVTIIKFFVLS